MENPNHFYIIYINYSSDYFLNDFYFLLFIGDNALLYVNVSVFYVYNFVLLFLN